MVKDPIIMLLDQDEKNEVCSTGIGPGDRLQAARIQKGLSVEDIAAQMHLSVSIVKAVEENNFDKIPAPMFVKGYLRAYARIVLLDEDEMVSQYMECYSEEDPPINSTSHAATEISVDDARFQWSIYLIVAILAGLIIVWWWHKGSGQPEPISLDSETIDTQMDSDISAADEAMIAREIEASLSAAREAEAAQQQVELVSDESEQSNIQSRTSELENTLEQAKRLALISESASELTNESAKLEESEITAQNSIVAQVPSEVTQIPSGQADELEDHIDRLVSPIAPTGTDKIEINVHGDTWVDITDKNGHQLAYNLLVADESLKIMGQAPFAVFFGNGHGVELIYNENPIDVTPFTRSDSTARLKVGN